MARIGIVFGLLLCGLTLVGMSVTTQKSYTQFVPMMFGIPMLFLGVVSLNPHRRSEAVLFALGLSLVAMMLGGGRLLVLALHASSGRFVNPVSLRLVLVMTTLSFVFVVIAWLWRRRRAPSLDPASTDPATTDFLANPQPASPPALDSPDSAPAAFSDNPYQSPTILDDAPIPDNSTALGHSAKPDLAKRPALTTATNPDSSKPPLSRSEST